MKDKNGIEYDGWALKQSWDDGVYGYPIVRRTRTETIKAITKWSGHSWEKMKGFGYECVKVKITVVE